MTIVYTNTSNINFADISYHDQTPVDFDIMRFPMIRSSRIKFSCLDGPSIQHDILSDAVSKNYNNDICWKYIPFSMEFTQMEINLAIIGPDMFGFHVKFFGYFSSPAGYTPGLVGYLDASRWYKTPRNVQGGCESGKTNINHNYQNTVFSYIDQMERARKIERHPNARGINRVRAFAKWKTLLKTP